MPHRISAHTQPRPEPNDPRRRTEPEADGEMTPESGYDDPDQGRPGPSRGPRPKDDVREAPEGGEKPEVMAPRRRGRPIH